MQVNSSGTGQEDRARKGGGAIPRRTAPLTATRLRLRPLCRCAIIDEMPRQAASRPLPGAGRGIRLDEAPSLADRKRPAWIVTVDPGAPLRDEPTVTAHQP